MVDLNVTLDEAKTAEDDDSSKSQYKSYEDLYREYLERYGF